MKNIIITITALLTFNIAFSQTVVSDPALLSQALEEAIASAKQLAIQEAERKLQQAQNDALNKVSSSLKSSGLLGSILEKQVKLLRNASDVHALIGKSSLSIEAKNNSYKAIENLVKEGDEVSKMSKVIMNDDDLKGNDAERLMILNQLAEQQYRIGSRIFTLKQAYLESASLDKNLKLATGK